MRAGSGRGKRIRRISWGLEGAGKRFFISRLNVLCGLFGSIGVSCRIIRSMMLARLHGSIVRATGDVKMGAGVRRTMALLLARSFGVVSTTEPPWGFGGLEKVTPIVYMSSEGKGVVDLGDAGRSQEMGDSPMVRAMTVTIPSFFETLPSEGEG